MTQPMNVHHLELFFYVAKNRGISQAVRNMPYGIQQPAVSGQILKLEQTLGVKLFNRRPFALTPAGEELYRFITPFFANLETMSEHLRGEGGQHLRLAASAVVLRDHLPDLVQDLRREHPKLKLTLREASLAQTEVLLQSQEIDLAIAVLEEKSVPGFHSMQLLRLPWVLLVEQKSKHRSAASILHDHASLTEPLITLPSSEPISRMFRAELADRGIQWPTGIEVNSIELIQTYVAKGFGIGLSVELPRSPLPKNIRPLPLKGFPALVIGALWVGKLSPVAENFLKMTQKAAKSLAAGA